MAVAGVLAQAVNLPGVIGTFFAGLAVNAAVRENRPKGSHFVFQIPQKSINWRIKRSRATMKSAITKSVN
jgi:hypothetical protein